MECLLFLALLFGLFVSPPIGNWILRPLVRHAGAVEAPRRFLLSDLIWLMLQLQAVIALGMQIFDRQVPASARIVIVLVFCTPVVVIWATSLHLASRAGIVHPLRRAVVVLLLIPLGIALAAALPVLLAATLLSLPLAYTLGESIPSRVDGQLWLAAPLFAVSLAGAFALRWVALWSLADGSSPTTSHS
jgi:hypothetical protein